MINIDDLEQQQVLGNASYTFFGLQMQQVPQALLKLNRLLNYCGFQRIIEIGTGGGGLSFLLSLWAENNNKEFYTFDVLNQTNPKYNLKECFHEGNALESNYTINYIKELIKKDGRVMLLCDAGKSIEFNIYASSLKVGDFILTHDYSKDLDFFNEEIKNKIWNHCENWYEKIEESCTKNNIQNFDYMQDAVWSLGIKQS